MASITRHKNGHRSIQFIAPGGKRKTIRIGKTPQKIAEGMRVKVEALLAAAVTGQPIDLDTARWLERLDQCLLKKLAATGLVADREAARLGAFTEKYIGGRTDIKERTRDRLRNARRHLIEYFGEERRLIEITAGEAEAWRIHLGELGLKPATVGKLIKQARQFFSAAIRLQLISSNPFASIKASQQVNPARLAFVPRTTITRVLRVCPDEEWRLLVVLARFGGLRIPSESITLRWRDIDWEKGRMLITSPKTEHHEGHGSREIPLFPELRQYLTLAREVAGFDAEYVITRYRHPNSNLGVPFARFLRRAGVEPWPKIFQNLRSTRETELAETYPLHVVCAWMGNSQPVAAKHYLQVTDDHFAQAAELEVRHPEASPESAAICAAQGDKSALQKAVQQEAARRRTESQQSTNSLQACEILRQAAAPCYVPPIEPVPPRGVEPLFSG